MQQYDYHIVVAGSNDDAKDKVNSLLLDGWKLAGGVCVDSNGILYQAVYRERAWPQP